MKPNFEKNTALQKRQRNEIVFWWVTQEVIKERKEKNAALLIIKHREESKQSVGLVKQVKTSLCMEDIYCISVRNPLLCLPSNPPVMCGGNPPNILTPVYSISVLGDLLRQSATSHREYCTSPTCAIRVFFKLLKETGNLAVTTGGRLLIMHFHNLNF
jgi:hypothetical protein